MSLLVISSQSSSGPTTYYKTISLSLVPSPVLSRKSSRFRTVTESLSLTPQTVKQIGKTFVGTFGSGGGSTYATFDPVNTGSFIPLSNANMSATSDASSYSTAFLNATPVSSGKYQYEVTVNTQPYPTGRFGFMLGLADTTFFTNNTVSVPASLNNTEIGGVDKPSTANNSVSILFRGSGSTAFASYWNSGAMTYKFTTGNIDIEVGTVISVCADFDTLNFTVYVNGTDIGLTAPLGLPSGLTWYPAVSSDASEDCEITLTTDPASFTYPQAGYSGWISSSGGPSYPLATMTMHKIKHLLFTVIVTPIVSMAKQSARLMTLVKSLSATPTIAKQLSLFRTITKTIALTPSYIKTRVQMLAFNASVSLTAAMTKQSARFKTIVKSLSLTPILTKKLSLSKIIAATISPIGNIIKQIGKTFVGTSYPLARMTMQNVVLLVLTAVLSPIASLAKQTSRFKKFVVTLSPVVRAKRGLTKFFKATLSPIASFTKRFIAGLIHMTFSASVAPVASLVKRIGIHRKVITSVIASATRRISFYRTFKKIVVPVVKVRRGISKFLATTLTPVGHALHPFTKLLKFMANVVPVANISKTILIKIVALMPPLASIQRFISVTIKTVKTPIAHAYRGLFMFFSTRISAKAIITTIANVSIYLTAMMTNVVYLISIALTYPTQTILETAVAEDIYATAPMENAVYLTTTMILPD